MTQTGRNVLLEEKVKKFVPTDDDRTSGTALDHVKVMKISGNSLTETRIGGIEGRKRDF